MTMEAFETTLREDLRQYLLRLGELDERMPDCPDVEEKWETVARSYMGDGIREFQQYPTASLGWMLYIGMAIAKYWDEEWTIYDKIEDLYAYIRDKRGYDHLDEYVCEEVLGVRGEERAALESLASELASRTYSLLRHQNIEPGTKEAFAAYVACLHQLYLMGMAMQLRRMGYHMTRLS